MAARRLLTTMLAAMFLNGCQTLPQAHAKYSRHSLYSAIADREHSQSIRHIMYFSEDTKQLIKSQTRAHNEDAKQIFQLNPAEFNIVAKLYDFFQHQENINAIAKQLEDCLKDNVEYGGYLRIKNDRLEFVKSCTNSGRGYTTIQIPPFQLIFGLYHFHISEEGHDAGPSTFVDLEDKILAENEIPGVIITNLKDSRKLNADVYFVKPPTVIDLGNYSY